MQLALDLFRLFWVCIAQVVDLFDQTERPRVLLPDESHVPGWFGPAHVEFGSNLIVGERDLGLRQDGGIEVNKNVFAHAEVRTEFHVRRTEPAGNV